jgi:hypothetical protein
MAEDRGAFKTNPPRSHPMSAFVIFVQYVARKPHASENGFSTDRAALLLPLFNRPQKYACDILDQA